MVTAVESKTEVEVCYSSSDEEWNDEFEEVSYRVITETTHDMNQWQHHQTAMNQADVVVSYEDDATASAAVTKCEDVTAALSKEATTDLPPHINAKQQIQEILNDVLKAEEE